MRTLNDRIQQQLMDYDNSHLAELASYYREDSHMAKSYSIFCFLVAMGYGCDQKTGEAFAELLEAFFLATSIHDDIVDKADKINEELNAYTINERIVLGDIFFIELSLCLANLVMVIDQQNREDFLSYFHHEMMVVAQSQIADQAMAFEVCTPESSLDQSENRGGSWGRVAMGSVAHACGVPAEEISLLKNAANNIFIALTILDDLQDLEDDLSNGIYTLAPCYYCSITGDNMLFKSNNFKKVNKVLIKKGALNYALQVAVEYAQKANLALAQFIKDKEGMYWFQLKSFFETIEKQLVKMKEVKTIFTSRS